MCCVYGTLQYLGRRSVMLEGSTSFDVTSKDVPTVRDLLELQDPVAWIESALGADLGLLSDIEANSIENPDVSRPYLLSPCDLQPVKACGVTFVSSMLERVIEEQALGDADKALFIRARCQEILGNSLRGVKPGSEKAFAL